MVSVRVDLGERGYDVLVGEGVIGEVSGFVPEGARRATVVTQDEIGVEVDPGVPYEVVTITGGEKAKSLATVEEICRSMSRGDMHRGDVVVAVGGGVVTDVAGYAASSYHRGIAVIARPHDPARSGRRRDRREDRGQPSRGQESRRGRSGSPSESFVTPRRSDTLPERERRSGHGEMAKYAFLGVEDLDELPIGWSRCAPCVELKAEVVAGDEREGGRRLTPQLRAHACARLEAAGFADRGRRTRGIELRHGEAVGIGLGLRGRSRPSNREDRRPSVSSATRQVVSGYDLPTTLPAGADPDTLIAFMTRDKKAAGDLMMILDGPAGVEAGSRRCPRARPRSDARPSRRPMSGRRRGSERRRPAGACQASDPVALRAPISACSASASPRSTVPRHWRSTSGGRSRRRPGPVAT